MQRLSHRPLTKLAVLLAAIAAPAGASGIVLPPSLIQHQADKENKAAQGAAEPGAANRPATKDQAQSLGKYRTAALGDDPVAATAAVRQLRAMGEPAKPTLHEVVGKLLGHDRSVIQNAHGLASASELRDLSDKIMLERKDARENIDKLAHGDDTIPAAHRHFDSLKAMWDKLHGSFVQADAVAIALSRRGELINLWRDLAPADKQYSDDSEIKLAAQAERAFGFTPAQMSALPEIGQGPVPAEPVLRDLWLFRACRRIAAYNASLSKSMTPAELENLQVVNIYREYLGILPYEADPRLVNAARAHCQEMITLKYFAHESPVPANKTPWDRIAAAGYKGGSGENIAMGAPSGEKAFWMWFDSPGHHQNIASTRNTALGVGNIGIYWTQDMGAAPRLMLASPADRKQALGNVKAAPKDG